jgi:hypothetical protein
MFTGAYGRELRGGGNYPVSCVRKQDSAAESRASNMFYRRSMQARRCNYRKRFILLLRKTGTENNSLRLPLLRR